MLARDINQAIKTPKRRNYCKERNLYKLLDDMRMNALASILWNYIGSRDYFV